MKSETYIDDHYCPVCQKETACEFYSDGHERDSSGCRITCTICKSVDHGITGEWYTDDGRFIKE